MAEDHIRYDILAQEALRGVVRKVLNEVSKTGLPGEHHFFIGFDTCASGVQISSRLKEQYPEEMTIVLQHQFWDLIISETHFEIGLSFNGIAEHLSVPFAAIKAFFDPSVQFGLQFELVSSEAENNNPFDNDDEAKQGEYSLTSEDIPSLNTNSASSSSAEKTKVSTNTKVSANKAESHPHTNGPTQQNDVSDKNSDESEQKEPHNEQSDEGNVAQVVSLDAFRKKS